MAVPTAAVCARATRLLTHHSLSHPLELAMMPQVHRPKRVTALPSDPALLPPETEREELTFAFDTARYDFRALVIEMFKSKWTEEGLYTPATSDAAGSSPADQPGAGPADGDGLGTLLSNLHLTDVRRGRCRRTRGQAGGSAFHARFQEVMAHDSTTAPLLRERFHSTLLAFVREVCAPVCRRRSPRFPWPTEGRIMANPSTIYVGASMLLV